MSDRSPGGWAGQGSWGCGRFARSLGLSVQGSLAQREDHCCTLHKDYKGAEAPVEAHWKGIEGLADLSVTEIEQQPLVRHLLVDLGPLWADETPQIHWTELDLVHLHVHLQLTSEASNQELFAPWAPPSSLVE